jgi:hypothetical protein
VRSIKIPILVVDVHNLITARSAWASFLMMLVEYQLQVNKPQTPRPFSERRRQEEFFK